MKRPLVCARHLRAGNGGLVDPSELRTPAEPCGCGHRPSALIAADFPQYALLSVMFWNLFSASNG
jgi:hypothetical protein